MIVEAIDDIVTVAIQNAVSYRCWHSSRLSFELATAKEGRYSLRNLAFFHPSATEFVQATSLWTSACHESQRADGTKAALVASTLGRSLGWPSRLRPEAAEKMAAHTVASIRASRYLQDQGCRHGAASLRRIRSPFFCSAASSYARLPIRPSRSTPGQLQTRLPTSSPS